MRTGVQEQKFRLVVPDYTPEFVMVLFDLTFWSTFFIGWVLTWIFNRDYIADSPVVRVFGVFNVCIGIDSYPARYVAIPMSCLAFFFFVSSTILFLLRIQAVDGPFKPFRRALLIVATLCSIMFSWSVGIEPTDHTNPAAPGHMRQHLNGFGIGCLGWAFLKLASILEWEFTRPRHDNDRFGLRYMDCKTIAFLGSEAFMFLILLISSATLMSGMAAKSDADLMLLLQTPREGKVDILGNGLVACTFFLPIMATQLNGKRREVDATFEFTRTYISDEHYAELQSERKRGRHVVKVTPTALEHEHIMSEK